MSLFDKWWNLIGAKELNGKRVFEHYVVVGDVPFIVKLAWEAGQEKAKADLVAERSRHGEIEASLKAELAEANADLDLWQEKYRKADEIADEFLSKSMDTNVSEKIYTIATERDRLQEEKDQLQTEWHHIHEEAQLSWDTVKRLREALKELSTTRIEGIDRDLSYLGKYYWSMEAKGVIKAVAEYTQKALAGKQQDQESSRKTRPCGCCHGSGQYPVGEHDTET